MVVSKNIERESKALEDIAAERERQMDREGWTPDHDDKHGDGALPLAAACYAISAAFSPPARPPVLEINGVLMPATAVCRDLWPWEQGWWKPKSAREDLVRAGALIVAEIERLDRKKDGAYVDQPQKSDSQSKSATSSPTHEGPTEVHRFVCKGCAYLVQENVGTYEDFASYGGKRAKCSKSDRPISAYGDETPATPEWCPFLARSLSDQRLEMFDSFSSFI